MSKDIVLLPGLNTLAYVWDPVVSAVTDKSWRWHLLDCPAFEAVEEIARAFAVNLPPTFHLIGFSMGGYVALALAELFPDRVKSLMLVSSAADADNEAQRAFRQLCVAAADRGDHEEMNATGAHLTLHPDSAKDPEVLGRYLAMMCSYGRDRFRAHSIACAVRPSRADFLIGCKLPVAVVGGEADKVVSLKRQAATASLAGVAPIVIPGAGHQVPLERPELLADVIASWLNHCEQLCSEPQPI